MTTTTETASIFVVTKFGAVEDFVNKRLASAGLSRVEDNGA